jgi:hypothetical protein
VLRSLRPLFVVNAALIPGLGKWRLRRVKQRGPTFM